MRLSGLIASATMLLVSTAVPSAHPHVFAEAKLDVEVDQGQTIKTLKHLWRFDELFSSTVLMDFDKNADLVLDAQELDAAALTINASLAEFNYFQMVTIDGKDVAMKPPAKLIALYENNQLVMQFETQPKEALPLTGKVSIGVYDPSFYTAIEFTDDDTMAVVGLPQRCSRAVIRPDANTAIAQNQKRLTDAFFTDPAGTNLAKIFATRLELTCA